MFLLPSFCQSEGRTASPPATPLTRLPTTALPPRLAPSAPRAHSLWHLVVLLLLLLSSLDYRPFSRLDVIVTYVAVVAFSYLLSLGSYLLIEKPAMNIEGALLSRAFGGVAAGADKRGGREARSEPPEGDGQPPLLQQPPWQPLVDPAAAAPEAAADYGV